MRKLFQISPLLIVLLCPSALAYLAFAWQKHQVKQAVKAQLLVGMDASELTELKFSKADAEALLEWEHSREFEYQSQMYDVVDMSIEGDSIRYLCYRDHAESRIKQELRRLLALPVKDAPATSGNTRRLATFYQSLFCVKGPSWVLPAWEKTRADFFYTAPSGLPAGPPPAPPPEA